MHLKVNTTPTHALYSDFSVGDSNTNYRLSVSGYNANVARLALADSLIGNLG